MRSFKYGLVLMLLAFLRPVPSVAEVKDILFVRHGQSSFNQMMEHKRGLQKLKSLTFSRNKIKDANLTQTGIVEALRLRSHLLDAVDSEDETIQFIAKSLLEPRDDVLVLASNLRRAVNTGLLVLYGDDRDHEAPKNGHDVVYPVYISSLLQEWGVPQAVPDVQPFSKNFFEQGQLINEPIESSLGSFADDLHKYLHIYPDDSEISVDGRLRSGTGNTKPLKDKYAAFLQSIVFNDSDVEGLDVASKKVFVVFGHGRWLKGFVNFIKEPDDPKMGIVSNASLTHMKVEKQEDGSFHLLSRECYRSL